MPPRLIKTGGKPTGTIFPTGTPAVVADAASATRATPGMENTNAAEPPSRTPRRETIIQGSIPDTNLNNASMKLPWNVRTLVTLRSPLISSLQLHRSSLSTSFEGSPADLGQAHVSPRVCPPP